MARYTFNWRYASNLGAGKAGETQEIEDDLAAAIDRDSPGVLSLVDETPQTESRAVEDPPHDRMQRKPAGKRGAS